MTQHQANQAAAICEQMQKTIAKLQRDFDEMKKAADEFNERMAREYTLSGAR